MKKINYFMGSALAIVTLSTMLSFSSCGSDSEELVVCDGVCDSSTPYSNSWTTYCYSSKSSCQEETGHACKRCD